MWAGGFQQRGALHKEAIPHQEQYVLPAPDKIRKAVEQSLRVLEAVKQRVAELGSAAPAGVLAAAGRVEKDSEELLALVTQDSSGTEEHPDL